MARRTAPEMWHDASAVGAKEDSPALQRWVGGDYESESRRDDNVAVLSGSCSAVPTALKFLLAPTQCSTTPTRAKSPQQTQIRRLLGAPKKTALFGDPVRTGLSSFAPHGARLGRPGVPQRGTTLFSPPRQRWVRFQVFPRVPLGAAPVATTSYVAPESAGG